MSESIKAIVYEAHGKPEEMLRLEEQPLREVAAGEALVRVLAAPVNPADLNQIEGKYPIRFPLPATPGFEGAGIVEAVGAERAGSRTSARRSSCRTTSAPGGKKQSSRPTN